MHTRMLATVVLAGPIALATGCGGGQTENGDGSEIDTVQSTLSGSNHVIVTNSAVPNVATVLATRELANTCTIGDQGDANQYSRSHFDNCYWSESIGWMNQNRKNAVDASVAYHNNRTDANRQNVFNSLGYVIHAVQDFYAHSNWPEAHSDPNAIATLATKPIGWYSGTYNNPKDGTGPGLGPLHCPANTPEHDAMSKDSQDRPGYPGSFSRAMSQATRATSTEITKFYDALRGRSGLPVGADHILMELGFLSASTMSSLDDVILYPDGRIFFFYGDDYLRYNWTNDSVDSGYPKPVSGYWPGLWTNGFDAATTHPNGKLYFFKGSQYIRYDIAADSADAGYPLSIASNWPGLWSSGINAILPYPNGKLYFFKGTQYIRYDAAADSADAGYPLPIAGNWPGVWSDGVDAAFIAPNGKAYFFKGSQYLRYDIDADSADFSPRATRDFWPGL